MAMYGNKEFTSFLEVLQNIEYDGRRVTVLTLDQINLEYVITENLEMYFCCKKCKKIHKALLITKDQDLKKLIKQANKHYMEYYQYRSIIHCPFCKKELK